MFEHGGGTCWPYKSLSRLTLSRVTFQTCSASLSGWHIANRLHRSPGGHCVARITQGWHITTMSNIHHCHQLQIKGTLDTGSQQVHKEDTRFQNPCPPKAYLQHCPCAITEALGCTPHSLWTIKQLWYHCLNPPCSLTHGAKLSPSSLTQLLGCPQLQLQPSRPQGLR